jgi:hemerythrin-like domain-containing protein
MIDNIGSSEPQRNKSCEASSVRIYKEVSMNAFTLLKADHQKVAGILEKLEGTTERATKGRDELFAQLKSELDVHSRIEETILYPALEEYEETRDIALEAYEEHAVVKQLLEDLESSNKADEHWTAKFTVLKENIEHHVEEEEGEMFTKARKVLSEEDINKLGERLEAAKKVEKSAKAG